MAISSLSTSPMMTRLSAMKQQFETLQMQLSTGRKSETYGGLGTGRSISITFNGRISALDSYAATMQQVSLRMQLMDSSLDRMSELPSEVKTALDPNVYTVRSDGRTDGQKTALIALDEMIGLLNTEADGRYLFSGQDTGTKPVVSLDAMLYGDGDKAGLKQVIAERAMADLGAPDAEGNQTGRLSIAAAANTVTLAKPAATSFGFSISAATGNLSNVTQTPNGTPPTSIDFSFTGQPAAGESIRVTLSNPDGTSSVVELTASSEAGGEGTFQIGADADETAANFAAALSDGVAAKAATELRAASSMVAADNFFDTANGGLPQRVVSNGGDFYTATGLADADPADTVIWYTGQNTSTTSARSAVTARIDNSISVSYGARANESALADVVKSLAVAAVETFDTTKSEDADRYRALAERVRTGLTAEGQQTPRDIQAELAVAAKTVESTQTRNAATKLAFQDVVGDVESVSEEEVAAMLLQLQTQMEASYQTISMLSQLSLVNYV